jgi:hypothetical protein
MPNDQGLLHWVPGELENGHLWERGYADNRLIATRCKHCGEEPENVTDTNFRVVGCRGVYGNGRALLRRHGVRLQNTEQALEHMEVRDDALVLLAAAFPEQARILYGDMVQAAKLRWGDDKVAERAGDWELTYGPKNSRLRVVTSRTNLDGTHATALVD